MGRPITKSRPIIFRASVEDYALLEQRAEAKNMTVNQLVAETIALGCDRLRAAQ